MRKNPSKLHSLFFVLNKEKSPTKNEVKNYDNKRIYDLKKP